METNKAGEQVIGREGETATFLSRRLFNSELRGFGFAPRQLRRSAASRVRNRMREAWDYDKEEWRRHSPTAKLLENKLAAELKLAAVL